MFTVKYGYFGDYKTLRCTLIIFSLRMIICCILIIGTLTKLSVTPGFHYPS